MKPLRPQKYIYKLNSTYLDMNDYNVNIELKDVFNNPECVISVGHSQLIKWIEELTGTEDNYLEAEKLRKEIKALNITSYMIFSLSQILYLFNLIKKSILIIAVVNYLLTGRVFVDFMVHQVV